MSPVAPEGSSATWVTPTGIVSTGYFLPVGLALGARRRSHWLLKWGPGGVLFVSHRCVTSWFVSHGSRFVRHNGSGPGGPVWVRPTFGFRNGPVHPILACRWIGHLVYLA